MSHRIVSLLMSGLLCSALAACSSAPKKEAVVPAKPAPVAAAPAAPAAPVAASTPQPTAEQLEQQRLAALRQQLAKQSVFFDFNEYSLGSDDQATVSKNADYLSKDGTVRVVVQGNADERGSSEYNLALGQKRAEAVRRALVIDGVPENRVEAISYGSEKPRGDCHEESCWSQNRRVDFAYGQ